MWMSVLGPALYRMRSRLLTAERAEVEVRRIRCSPLPIPHYTDTAEIHVDRRLNYSTKQLYKPRLSDIAIHLCHSNHLRTGPGIDNLCLSYVMANTP